jgi:hypothetical protein
MQNYQNLYKFGRKEVMFVAYIDFEPPKTQ